MNVSLDLRSWALIVFYYIGDLDEAFYMLCISYIYG